jgi:hypothetical protein
MPTLRYRPKDADGHGVGDWRRIDVADLSEMAFITRWGADLELAIEDDHDPTTLILLPAPRRPLTRRCLDTLHAKP